MKVDERDDNSAGVKVSSLRAEKASSTTIEARTDIGCFSARTSAESVALHL